MANYIQPSQDEFDSAEAVVRGALSDKAPGIMSKAGSAVRELVVRPLAYLMSWALANMEDIRTRTSVRYLSQSQSTDNPYADLIAENYFVTRNSAGYSRGAVTLAMTKSTLRIPQGSRFNAQGTALEVAKQVMVQPGGLPQDTDSIAYVRSIPSGDVFLATVPVVCIVEGAIEIPSGVEATVEFLNNTVVSATVTSPVTGGRDAETDAALIRRAALNTAEAGIGSVNGIRKKLLRSPVPVEGIMVCAGEDAPLFRARYNNLSINPGGIIDCYVKTQSQSATMELDLEAVAEDGADFFKVTIPATACPGLITVNGVHAFVDADGDGTFDDTEIGGQVSRYDVAYGTSMQATGAEGARLSCYQVADITFKPSDVDLPEGQAMALTDTVACRVVVSYMPGLLDIQRFLESDTERFIGQDIMVKSAIPASVALNCCVSATPALSLEELAKIRQALSAYVNGLPVGARTINFSDLVKACNSVVPRAELRLPANFTITIPNRDNGSAYVWHSVNGIADITNSAIYGSFDHRMCFFSLPVAGITLQEV